MLLNLVKGKIMKHSSLKITLLAASLLLAGCNSALSTISSTSSALASSASESLSSTSEVSSSSEASSTTSSSDETSTSTLISSSSSSQDVRSNYGDFSLVQTTNGTAPTYDETSNTWTIGVSAKKATYTVSGYFKGKIVVANPSNLTDYKGVVIKLNQAYIESDDDKTCAITYSNDAKYLALETVSGTVNYISGAAGAVESSNNLRLGGVGNLYLLSAMGHGAKGDDILLYGVGDITIAAAADGLHGHDFFTNDSEDTPTEFSGTLTVKGVGEQALDFSDGSGTSDDPWTGSIMVDSEAKIVVDTAQNVARANLAITVAGSITATNILGDQPIITKNSGALVVTILEGASFLVNGVALQSQTL